MTFWHQWTHPLSLCTWIATLSIFVAFIYYNKKLYYEYYEERIEQMAPDRVYVRDFCTSADSILKYNIAEECHRRRHAAERDPSDYALYDIIESWGLHAQTFYGIRFPLELIGTITLLTLLLFCVCGVRLTNRGYEYSRQAPLPTFMFGDMGKLDDKKVQ